ncbi:phosphoribosylaminoimidazolesuccinocarboxamide synthase [Candidatus Sumerlaeota bacterium]|nr:phosphoribosylaminoimidazolesuccinocarboxamide synthase [Candidatus Sumerlaeota bacterium]
MLESNIAGLPKPRRGKVRDVYDLGEKLLIVTTDRISAFDCIFPNGIPNKGRVLNTIALYWFRQTSNIVENHVISDDPRPLLPTSTPIDDLRWRCMVVRKCRPIDVECVVRGYLDGSAWVEYQKEGTVAREPAPKGWRRKHRFDEPVFTPATKAQIGHDENISFARVIDMVGRDVAERLRSISIALYKRAHDEMLPKGHVLSDTKFEFGWVGDDLILIDEALTPDSSRFFERDSYVEDRKSVSMDKQFVRDWCETTDWDKNPPAPRLPDEIVQKTSEKYLAILEIITGQPAPWL